MQHLEQENQSKFNQIPYVYRLIATGLGSGYSPIASGTAGSAVAVVLYLPLLLLPSTLIQPTLLLLTILALVIGIIASAKVEKAIGDDPSIVVIDEVVGQWISLLFLPVSVWSIVSAFFLFRIYDIFKPSPAREAESMKNGWGIMMDDVVAGVYANVTTRVVLFVVARFL